MGINLDKTLRIIRIVLWLLVGAVVIFLAIQKMVFSDHLAYSTDFIEQSKFIEGPYPDGRVEKIYTSERILYKILHEPVYFNVYSPQRFNKVVVRLKYRLPESSEARIGIKRNGGFVFDYLNLEKTGDEYKEATFEFVTENADRKYNKFQFVISSPGLSDQIDKIYIEKIGFDFSR